MADTQTKRKGWAAPLAGLLALGGLAAVIYVSAQALTKPESGGYAQFAAGALAKLAVLEAPPPQPDLPIFNAQGEQTALAALPGRVRLVNVWATWCAPCLHEMPTLAALQQEFGAKGLYVAAVNVDGAEKLELAVEMLGNLGQGRLDFYVDPSLSMPVRLNAPGLPISVLYDAQGRELARLMGGADWSSPEAKALIERALQES